jgi:hypothetical protein
MLATKPLTVLLLLAMLGPAYSQTADELALLKAQIEAMRTVSATERKIVIIRELNMTSAEAEKFWPLYEDYHDEMNAIDDLRAKIVAEYASRYNDMTDELADKLLDQSIDYTDKKQKLKKKYVKKFRAILPGIKVTRYFQLENKLDAIVDYQLAARIPLLQ